MTTNPKIRTLIGMVSATALIGAAFTVPAQAMDFPYDFNSLSTGTLTGQDGWYITRAYWNNAIIVSDTAPGGTSNMVQQTVGGVTGARALPTGTYFFGNETAAVLQYDVKATRGYSSDQVWLGGNGTQTHLGDDFAGAQAQLGPMLGFYNSAGGVYNFRLGSKNTAADAGTDGGWIMHDQASSVPLGHWITLKLVMDFTANGGAGSGSVFYKDLTNGDSGFTAVSSLQNINLGLNNGGMATGYIPGVWNQIGFDMNPVDTYAESMDNLFVSDGKSGPPPPPPAYGIMYDFNSLSTGTLVGQDGWYIQRTGGNPASIVTDRGPNGTNNMVQNNTNVVGARALPSGTYYTGTETGAVLQYDVKWSRTWTGTTMWVGGNGTQTHLSDDWYGSQAQLGPSLGFYNATGGNATSTYNFQLGAKNTAADAGNDGGWIRYEQVSTVPLGHWVTLRLVMDFTANGGAGSGSLFYKDLTANDVNFTPMSALQNINLGLTNGGMATGCTPDKWNQMGFYLEGTDTTESLDNIYIWNGVSDVYAAWASGYGLDPLTTGAANADPDHDGIQNSIEFVTGTNPIVANFTPPVETIYGTDNTIYADYRRATASTYLNPVLQTSTTLADGSWADVTANIDVLPDGAGYERVYVTIPSDSAPRRFIRLKTVNP